MFTPSLRRPALLIASASALLLAGCVVAPMGRYGGYGGAYGGGYGAPAGQAGQPYGDVVNLAPPAPQAEYIDVAPALGYLWLAGYWGWVGGRHTWVPGYWSAPRAGHSWVPHGWVRSGHGWHLNQGHWQRH